MYKLILVVLALIAVAAAQYVGYGGAYRHGYYGGYASPYAYNRPIVGGLGYGYGYYG